MCALVPDGEVFSEITGREKGLESVFARVKIDA